MKPFSAKRVSKSRPEARIQVKIICMLRMKGWFIKETHGNMYSSGFPDLFACHSRYGQRWIEVKLPGGKGSKFTNAQMEDFPKICANGSGVWVLTGDSEEEYEKLFKPPNWFQYLDLWKNSRS